MARRHESLLQILIYLPWWVGVLVGFFGYAACSLVGPMIFDTPFEETASRLPRLIGYFFLIICLVGAGGSAFRSWFVRRKFDQLLTIEDIRRLTWQEFEVVVGEAFRRLGYHVVENGGGGADGGVDIVLGRNEEKFFVQCKHWKLVKVGVKPVRELAGVMSAKGVRDGFFVTTGDFTEEAREFAQEAGIALVDGDSLARMLSETKADGSCPNLKVERVIETHQCPSCGGRMVKRKAMRGANVGKEFWGCATFPKCRGTRAA